MSASSIPIVGATGPEGQRLGYVTVPEGVLRQALPYMGHAEIAVTGVLSVGELSHTTTFTPSTTVDAVVAACLQPIKFKFKTLFGEDLEVTGHRLSLAARLRMGQDTPLNRLHPDVNSNAVHKCTVTFDVAPHQQTMLRGIIDKNKELLRENLELGDVVEKLPQNITKGRKGAKPKNVVDPSPIPALELKAPVPPAAAGAESALVAGLQKQFLDFATSFQQQLAELKADNQLLKADNQRLREENEDMRAELKELRSENRDLKAVNKLLLKRVDKLETENKMLISEVRKQSSTIRELHRRIVLDQARHKLVQLYHVDQRLRSNEEVRDDVRAKVTPEIYAELGEDAFDIIFVGKIRRSGNTAAHVASKEDLSLSVLDQRLGEAERACLRKIYKFTNNEEPMLSDSVVPTS